MKQTAPVKLIIGLCIMTLSGLTACTEDIAAVFTSPVTSTSTVTSTTTSTTPLTPAVEVLTTPVPLQSPAAIVTPDLSTTTTTSIPLPPASSTAPSPIPSPEYFTVNLVVEHNTFNFSVVNVPANAPVVINFVNKDNIPHNFAVYQNANASLPVFVGEAINGPGSGTYQFVTPSVGLYYFRSDADNTVRAGMFVVQ